MKKTIIAALAVLMAAGVVAAQDTITIHPPEFPDNYFKAGWWQEFDSIGYLEGHIASPNLGEYAYRMFTEDTLTVYGLAAAMSTRELVYPHIYEEDTIEWFRMMATIKDTSYDYVYDFLRIYEIDTSVPYSWCDTAIYPIGEDLKVHIKHTPVSYYLNTGLRRYYTQDQYLPILPVYERYFSEPVTVADSFYVGRKFQSHRLLTEEDPYAGCIYSTKPIELYGLKNCRSEPYVKSAGTCDTSADRRHLNDPQYYVWVKDVSYRNPLIFPILTPEDTTRHNGDTLSIGSVSLLDRLTGVMPNPASGRVKVVSSLGLRQVEVFNAAGDKVHSQTASGLSITLDTSPWPAGTYLVRITTEQGVTTRKLVIR